MEEPTLWSFGVKASKSASLSIASANITTFFRIKSYFHKKITKPRIFLSKIPLGTIPKGIFVLKL